MAAQRGKDMLFKLRDDANQLVTVAGLRTRRIVFDATAIDITHAESAGRWRELLSGAGVRRAQITGAGLFKDAASDALVRQRFFTGALVDAELTVPDFGIISGPFQISALDYRGDHAGEVTFEITLDSAGALAFASV